MIAGDSKSDDPLSLCNARISVFFQHMPHLTNLVLSLGRFTAEVLDMTDLHFPALTSIDMTGDTAPLGLIRFVAGHSGILCLHLHFVRSAGGEPFLPQDLPKLRALKWKMNDSSIFMAFLGRLACTRRPHIDHLFVYNLLAISLLKHKSMPFCGQIRRLDLQLYDEKLIFKDEFCNSLRSFTALVELSITITSKNGRFRAQSIGNLLSFSQLDYLAAKILTVFLARILTRLQKLLIPKSHAP
ncbi:hypothetical protein SCHPADRAFT_562038 [Schizopora paradoxa]|uniref:F-box domain-containing protein n=1 Tax=Schizopora paradoxa TaxID=27342 RepID=A0A0H2RCL4_9AGAM|nr:hypothetical protein SCHPADRAFT_562038 [Schizopora paradoxa]